MDLGGNLEFGIWNLGSNAGRWEATRANGKPCVPRIGLGIFEVDAGIIYCGTPRIVDCEKPTRREYFMTRLTSVAILAQNTLAVLVFLLLPFVFISIYIRSALCASWQTMMIRPSAASA